MACEAIQSDDPCSIKPLWLNGFNRELKFPHTYLTPAIRLLPEIIDSVNPFANCWHYLIPSLLFQVIYQAQNINEQRTWVGSSFGCSYQQGIDMSVFNQPRLFIRNPNPTPTLNNKQTNKQCNKVRYVLSIRRHKSEVSTKSFARLLNHFLVLTTCPI